MRFMLFLFCGQPQPSCGCSPGSQPVFTQLGWGVLLLLEGAAFCIACEPVAEPGSCRVESIPGAIREEALRVSIITTVVELSGKAHRTECPGFVVSNLLAWARMPPRWHFCLLPSTRAVPMLIIMLGRTVFSTCYFCVYVHVCVYLCVYVHVRVHMQVLTKARKGVRPSAAKVMGPCELPNVGTWGSNFGPLQE